KQIQFDFIVHGLNEEPLEKIFKDYNSQIYHVTPKKHSFIKNYIEIKKVIKNGNYDIIHCHQNYSSVVPLYIAKRNNVNVRIAHAHGIFKFSNLLQRLKFKILRYCVKTNANYLFACSLDAGKNIFGRSWYPNSKNMIMKNAIFLDKFIFQMI